MESSSAKKLEMTVSPSAQFDHSSLHFSKTDSGYESFYTSADTHIATNILFSTPNYRDPTSLILDESSIKLRKYENNIITSDHIGDSLLSSSSCNPNLFTSNSIYHHQNIRNPDILAEYNRISHENPIDGQLFGPSNLYLIKHIPATSGNENANILNIDHNGKGNSFVQSMLLKSFEKVSDNQSRSPETQHSLLDTSSNYNANLLTPKKKKCRKICVESPTKSKKSKSSSTTCQTNKVKRKLHIPVDECKEKLTRRAFFNGTTHLSLIEKLEPYPLASDKILNYLSGSDIFNLSLVSHNYKRIVESNLKALNKLTGYRREINKRKENHTIKMDSDSLNQNANFKSGTPFSTCNANPDLKQRHRSPIISPSKRLFHENQKIVRSLSSCEKIIRCPRCSNFSRIVEDTQRDDFPNFNSLPIIPTHFTSLYSSSQPFVNFAHSSLRQPIEQNKKISQSHYLSSKSNASIIADRTHQTPYGRCTRTCCNFIFCLKCLCENHIGQCILSKQVSPSKEDVENGILQMQYPIKRDKKSSRKSLKRLCF